MMDAIKVMTQGMLAECEAEDPFPVPLPGLARAALAALEAAGLLPQWRPIETAPRDDTPMLITDGIVQWVGWTDGEFWSVEATHPISETMAREPTHWQPLPAPPETR